MRTKAKFDKKKCLKCKYHTSLSIGHHVRDEKGSVHRVCCNYSCVTGTTCLRPISTYETEDLRGDDYNNCKLFSEGTQIIDRSKITSTAFVKHDNTPWVGTYK